MKNILSLVGLSLLLSFTVWANEIDNLKTNADVNRFLEKRFSKYAKELSLDADKTNTAEYGKNKFYKLDLDGNGLTDIVVDGKYFYAITDAGQEKYDLHTIDRGAFNLSKYSLAGIAYENKLPLLKIRSFDETSQKPGDIEKTILMKFGGFIEHNQKPDSLRIEEIKYSASGCFGTCPIFDLKIGRDGSATYLAKEYNDQEGKFTGKIDQVSFAKLIDTINYLGLKGLSDKYEVNWTDDQTATLEIRYDGGKTKKISDYGMIGTFGLENLYGQLTALRNSQQWTSMPGK